jgi:hypothetical protein
MVSAFGKKSVPRKVLKPGAVARFNTGNVVPAQNLAIA